MAKKTSIRLSLSPEAIAQLKGRARLNGYLWAERENISALVEAWAMGELDKNVGEAIARAQDSLKELAKSVEYQHPNPIFNDTQK